MVIPKWTRTACALLVWGACSVIQAEPPQLAAQPGILVLRNGRVLHGEILRVGDRFTVTMGEADEIGVPVDSVDLHCTSLQEAYRRKSARMLRPAKVADQLALADWCLQHGLLAAAAEQVMAAHSLDPRNADVAQFERRLHLAARQAGPPTVQERNRRTASAPRLLSQADLDQFMRDLPPGSVEQFTTSIQPLLANRCGASACHGPNATSDFRLTIPQVTRNLPRRFTQRNLHTTLQFIDKERPIESSLLKLATQVHGGSREPPLSPRDAAQLQQLVDWLQRCTHGRTPPPNLDEPPAVLSQPDSAMHVPADASPPSPSVAGASRQQQTVPVSTETVTGSPQVASAPATPDGQPAAGATDPFDPEVFNRRYHRRSD